MSKGVTEISRKGTAGGITSLSGHYEVNKLSEELNKRLENLEDRLAVTELKLFELEKGYSASVKDLREDLNANLGRSRQKHTGTKASTE